VHDAFFEDLVVRRRLIDEERLAELRERRESGEGSLFDLAMTGRELTEDSLYKELATDLGIPFLEKVERHTVPTDLLVLVPITFARQHRTIPVQEAGEFVVVAVADPLDESALDDVRTLLGKPVMPVVVPPSQITEAINELYERSGAGDELEEKEEEKEEDLQDILDLTDEAPIIRWVNSLFYQAVRQRASDIHIEPTDRDVAVRYRIDGVLYEVKNANRGYMPSIISRVKIMSGLNIAEKRLPQDGRISLKIAGKNIDVRVSTIPTSHGERIVMRLLDKSTVMLDLTDLGFSKSTYGLMGGLIRRGHGIILVTGPTGSGKTTTLYAGLSQINKPDINILTVEDPVEYDIRGISQMQVNPKINLTFASGLRHFLRQDPDVIMVGEIRDRETAEIAIHASLTGHLVLSTIHTNDASGALTRLVEMGVEPFLVASSMLAILAQRLVRVVCPSCRKQIHPTPEQLMQVGISPERLASPWLRFPEGPYVTDMKDEAPDWWGGNPVTFDAVGCGECENLGYHGRTGIYELLLITDKIRNLLLQNADSTTIKRAAVSEGMDSLRDDGAKKAFLGTTTLEEIMRVTQEDIE
jgi:general secretion pathway protein E